MHGGPLVCNLWPGCFRIHHLTRYLWVFRWLAEFVHFYVNFGPCCPKKCPTPQSPTVLYYLFPLKCSVTNHCESQWLQILSTNLMCLHVGDLNWSQLGYISGLAGAHSHIWWLTISWFKVALAKVIRATWFCSSCLSSTSRPSWKYSHSDGRGQKQANPMVGALFRPLLVFVMFSYILLY